MGKIVGGGLLSHAPVIMFPEAMRIEVNGGQDFTLATGLKQLRHEVIDQIDHDTVIILDTHWTTTTEFVIATHKSRSGVFTSAEMPTMLSQLPYDFPGDPELGEAICAEATHHGSWAAAVDDPHLPVQYAMLNLWTYLSKPNQSWLTISVCQTATTEDYLNFGHAIAKGVSKTDRRVMILASGGLSHKFHPLAAIRDHMPGHPHHIVSAEARAADQQRIAWLEAGQHRKVIETMPEFAHFEPEAGFGHYLMLAGALGGKNCSLPGKRYSEYESGIGTGHVHIWFTT